MKQKDGGNCVKREGQTFRLFSQLFIHWLYQQPITADIGQGQGTRWTGHRSVTASTHKQHTHIHPWTSDILWPLIMLEDDWALCPPAAVIRPLSAHILSQSSQISAALDHEQHTQHTALCHADSQQGLACVKNNNINVTQWLILKWVSQSLQLWKHERLWSKHKNNCHGSGFMRHKIHWLSHIIIFLLLTINPFS